MRHINLRLAVCFCLLSLATAFGAEPATPPTDPAKFEIYLLVGQSNMAGRGTPTAADREPVPRVLVLNAQNEWVSQGEPIHFDKPIAGVGLGFTFAKLMAQKKPDAVIGLVPCAVGGTNIAKWQASGELFKNAVERTKIAMKTGTLKGILWHQGEAECGNEGKAQAYAKHLAQIVVAFRQSFDAPEVPFIAGELGEFLSVPGTNKAPFAKLINEQIDSLPQLVPNTAVASSAGLKDKGDSVHFDADSQREFGKRYFEALLTLTEKK